MSASDTLGAWDASPFNEDTPWVEADPSDEQEMAASISQELLKGKHFWTQRDGTRIPISQMSDDHILNAVAYFQGKMVPRSRNQQIRALIKEAIRRGIQPTREKL